MMGTTPPAVLRARGLLEAWRRDDDETFRSILRVAERVPDEPAAFVNTTVALVALADRMLDYIAGLPEPHPGAHARDAMLDELQQLLITALNIANEGEN